MDDVTFSIIWRASSIKIRIRSLRNPIEACLERLDLSKQATIDDRWLHWQAKFCGSLRKSVIYDNLCETVLLNWKLTKFLNSTGRVPYANRSYTLCLMRLLFLYKLT